MDGYINKDFDDLIEFLQSNKLIPTERSKQVITKLKKVHKLAYSTAIWNIRLSSLSDNKKFYLNEIRSDIVQAIPLVLMGYEKSVAISLRGCIEGILKHIYYYDHPIEHQRALLDENYFMTKQLLIDYLKNHPSLKEIVKENDLISKLNKKYSNLSTIIHAKVIKEKKTVKCLKDIKFDYSYFMQFTKELSSIGCYINFLLCIFHQNMFSKFDSPTRVFIIRILEKPFKKSLSDAFTK